MILWRNGWNVCRRLCSDRLGHLRGTTRLPLQHFWFWWWFFRLDTPCTAGARRRWGYGISSLNIFERKVQKKSLKNWSNYFSFAKDIYTLATFLQKVSKPVFQNPTVEQHVPTLISASQKSPKIRTNERTNRRTDERTNGRNIWFWLADGRKERFAQ